MNKNKIKNFLILVFIGTTIIAASLGIFFSLKNTQNFEGYIKESDLLKKYHNEDLQILNKSIKNKNNARIMDTNKKIEKISQSIVDAKSLKSELNFELQNLSKNSEYIISAEPSNPWKDDDEKQNSKKVYNSSIKVSISIKTQLSKKEIFSKPVFAQVKYLEDAEITNFLQLFKDQKTSERLLEANFSLTHNLGIHNTSNSMPNQVKTNDSIKSQDISSLISEIYNIPSNPKKIKYEITFSGRDKKDTNKINYHIHSKLSNSVLESDLSPSQFSITYSPEK